MQPKFTDIVVLIYAGLSCSMRGTSKNDAFKEARSFVARARAELPEMFESLETFERE